MALAQVGAPAFARRPFSQSFPRDLQCFSQHRALRITCHATISQDGGNAASTSHLPTEGPSSGLGRLVQASLLSHDLEGAKRAAVGTLALAYLMAPMLPPTVSRPWPHSFL